MAPTPIISGVHFKRGSDLIFTNCCIVAIKDTEEVCPSCGRYVIGGGCGYTPEKIRKFADYTPSYTSLIIATGGGVSNHEI